MKNKSLILVTGPTASGKTGVAIQLALHFQTEIISADSRQCYRELNIGVAKPTPAQLATVRHHFINSHSIHEEVNAATFATIAHAAAQQIFATHDTSIMAGGTGLYIKAFTDGLNEIPAISQALRNKIRADYETNGLAWLQQQVQQHDPEYFQTGEIENPQRMMRALEVRLATGRSIRDFQKPNLRPAGFYNLLKFAIDVPREQLYANINKRVDEMMEQGLEEEARALYPYRHLNALQTVGYAELFACFDGDYTLQQAIEKIKQNTRNYAKRQLTWFRKDNEIVWVKGTEDILRALSLQEQTGT